MMADPHAFELAEPAPRMVPMGPVRTVGGMTPRDYQLTGLMRAQQAWMGGARCVLEVLATGLGKTVLFACQVQREVDAGGKALIVAHTDELLVQAADKLRALAGIEADREKAGERASLHSPVVVSSVQTLGRAHRLQGWPPDHFSLVVVDEAHRSLAKSYQAILAHFTGARVMGVTATPDRGDERSLGRIYEQVVFDYGLLQGVRDGWLVRPLAKTLPLKVDIRQVSTRRGADGRDFDATELAARLEPFIAECAGQLIEHAGRRKTVVFTPSVDTAKSLADTLASLGASADWVAGDRERCPDRRGRIERFRAGGRQFMCNAMLLTEGFDDPAIACVCVLRPTQIRALFVQCAGRASRPLPGLVDGLPDAAARRAAIAASAKPDFLILDPLWLTEQHSLIRPAHLVAGREDVAEVMKDKQGDLLDIEEQAERDLLESLKKAAARHGKKSSRLFDPLAVAMKIGDEELKQFKPAAAWEAAPVTDLQIKALVKAGFDPAKVTNRGMASLCLTKVEQRQSAGLATLKQATFLERLGVADAWVLSRDEAGRLMRRAMQIGPGNFAHEQRRPAA